MIASVIALLQIYVRLLADLVGLIALSVRPRRSLEAENLFLRRELALYEKRGIRPRRVDAATRGLLALLSRLFDWRDGIPDPPRETSGPQLLRRHRLDTDRIQVHVILGGLDHEYALITETAARK